MQYGLGRSGSHLWGFERRGLEPDIVTLGKPVANGYPMGVVVANRDLIEAFQQKFGFFSTFGGNAVAASAALAVLEVLERERLQENAADTGRYLGDRLSSLGERYPGLGAVRGTGLLLGLEVHASRRTLRATVREALHQSSRLRGPGADRLRGTGCERPQAATADAVSARARRSAGAGHRGGGRHDSLRVAAGSILRAARAPA